MPTAHSFPGDVGTAVKQLSACLVIVESWFMVQRLWASQLLLNLKKTVLMWLGLHQQLTQVDSSEVPVLSCHVRITPTVHDVGVIIDSHMSLLVNINVVCRCGQMTI
jgi:hypothetical protein